jgi:hypothetical protein
LAVAGESVTMSITIVSRTGGVQRTYPAKWTLVYPRTTRN